MLQKIEKHFNEKRDTLVKTLCARNRVSIDDAEDIVQEAYLRAIKYSESFNVKLSSFDTWMAQILRRTCSNYYNANRTGGSYVDLEDYHVSTTEDVLEACIKIEEVEFVIEQLQGERKQVSYLYFIKGMKPRDIVKLLDIGINKVNNEVRVVREYLKKAILEDSDMK